MKKIILMCGLAATLFSCAKEKHSEPLVSADPVDVVLNIEADAFGAETKATPTTEPGSELENKIHSIEVYAFNNNEKLVGYKLVDYTSSESKENITISVVPGTSRFYALANNHRKFGIKGIDNLSTLLAKSDTLQSAWAIQASGIPMFGYTSNIGLSQSGSTHSIKLKRNLARIDVMKITNKTEDVLASNPIVVNEIWLSNIVGSYMVDGSYSGALWYTKIGGGNTPYTARAEFHRNVAQTLASGESYTTPLYLYAGPNTNTNVAPQTWAEAATYFNLRCTIVGNTYDFKFKLPALEANNAYKINEVRISGTGALIQANLTLSAADWTTNIIGDGGLVEFGKQ